MCGIFAYLARVAQRIEPQHLKNCSARIQHRGPDNTKEVFLRKSTLFFSFHRLAINGLGSDSDEPLRLPNGKNTLWTRWIRDNY